ncbi:hypothetical protein TPY_2480 [Sulfobacillus acidophilus TPY]|uniref:Surface presentation of antigens (SPOA) protein n=1 Tax=Sulfobacillus acidophilus (strain ATCC 700253 / DSM 10332 / NAL) TaxID=679936 RepID=G8TSI7_SULAD|nr:hypothetical protein TPY_2480 [Sulfobacillus acidophilus TPY]AEW06679.1 surface presentation of antigens (SPOA) protein [Sulfobacillus acidophilus DSM 10332]
MEDTNRPLSQSEIDALLAALSPNPLAGESTKEATADNPAAVEAGETVDEALPDVNPPSVSAEAPSSPSSRAAQDPRLRRILHLPVTFSASLGEQILTVQTVLNWGVGSQFVLNRKWQDPVVVKLNGLAIGEARVMLVGNNFGVEITEWGTCRAE